MRVLMPTGLVMEITKVVAVSEQRLAFNGREQRLCERASDIGYANGIAFFPESRVADMTTESAILIGNLRNEQVRELLAALVQEGYADLSSLKLQKAQPQVSTCYVFDNGVSEAYMLQGYEVNMCCANALVPFVGGAFPAVSGAVGAEDTEDAGEEEDDE